MTGPRGEIVTDYTVVVFSTDAADWYQGSRLFTVTRPNADATFSVADLPPAEYYVAAVDWLRGSDAYGEWQDPAFLKTLAPRATRMRLNEGRQTTVALPLIVR